MPELRIRISQRSGETKTAQIFNQIASAILAGKFNEGDALPSERALAERLGVSRNIVRNAFGRLEDQGLVEAVSTAGRRVRGAKARGTAPVGRGGLNKGASKGESKGERGPKVAGREARGASKKVRGRR